jgi:hypothetical protein
MCRVSRRSTLNSAFSCGVLLALLHLFGAPAPTLAQAYVMEVATVVPDGSPCSVNLIPSPDLASIGV